VFAKDDFRRQVERFNDPVAEEDQELAGKVRAVLLRNIDQIDWLEPCLVHRDFWPGNTVWYRGHLAAVIDWSEACLGDLRSDVAQCQIEIAFTVDLATADRFLAAYERVSGPLPRLWFFALYRSMFALAHVRRWLVGYEDVGVDLDPDEVMTNLHAYIRHALGEAAAFAP
jgi:aminoglycoside phosphotransferase (APT) family kinase protein